MREGILTHGGSYGLKCESNSTKPPEILAERLGYFFIQQLINLSNSNYFKLNLYSIKDLHVV